MRASFKKEITETIEMESLQSLVDSINTTQDSVTIDCGDDIEVCIKFGEYSDDARYSIGMKYDSFRFFKKIGYEDLDEILQKFKKNRMSL